MDGGGWVCGWMLLNVIVADSHCCLKYISWKSTEHRVARAQEIDLQTPERLSDVLNVEIQRVCDPIGEVR